MTSIADDDFVKSEEESMGEDDEEPVKTEVKEEEEDMIDDVKEESLVVDELLETAKCDFEEEDDEDSYDDEDDDDDEEKEIDLKEHGCGNPWSSVSINASDLQDPLDLEIPISVWDNDQSEFVVGDKEKQPLSSRNRIHPECGLPDLSWPNNISTIDSIENHIQQFIESCVSSKQDPRGKQEFYFTIHYLLEKALEQNVIASVEEADTYWRKFDAWASNAYYRIRTSARSKHIWRANDPNKTPPSATWGYKHLLSRMETILRNFIMSARPRRPLRDDLFSRVKFYEIFRRYSAKMHLPVMDFFWNILLNRGSYFYNQQVNTPEIPAQKSAKLKNYTSKKSKSKTPPNKQSKQKSTNSAGPTGRPTSKISNVVISEIPKPQRGATTRSGRQQKIRTPFTFDSAADQRLKMEARERAARQQQLKKSANKKYGKAKIVKAAAAATNRTFPLPDANRNSTATSQALKQKLRPYLQLNNEGWILNLDNCGGPIIPSIWWEDPENQAICGNR